MHPIHSEVVSFVTCRNVLLSGLFFFLAGYFFLLWLEQDCSHRKAAYAAALICFIFSLYAKATSIILPLLLLLICRLRPTQRQNRTTAALIPFFIVSGATFFLFRGIAQYTHIMKDEPLQFSAAWLGSKLAVAVQIPYFYLLKLAIPFGFSADYDITFPHEPSSPLALTCMAGVIGILLLVVIYRRKAPLVALCVSWFFVALIPVLNLFPTHPIVADRYAYLPAFSLFILLVLGLNQLRFRIPKVRPCYAVAVLAIFWGILAHTQNKVWQTEKSLWSHAVTVSPKSTLALTNLGRIYFLDDRNYDKGLELLKKAQQLDSTNSSYDLLLGCLYLLRNEPHKAISAFQTALSRDSENLETLVNLGSAYERTGELRFARQYYAQAVNSSAPDPGDMRERARNYLNRLDK